MNILADTCFWISLCDPTDGDHEETVSMMEKIQSEGVHSILVPHPVLYETLCSNMVKKPEQVKLLMRFFSQVEKLPDTDYVHEAYRLVEQQANMNNGTASMVDLVIMIMANDTRNNVKAILTRNGRDFTAFCLKRGIPMVDRMAILEAL